VLWAISWRRAVDLEHLHLDDVGDSRGVGALDVDDRELQLGDRRALLRREQLDGGDAVGLVEVEHVVEERNQDVLMILGAEDPLEREVGLGVCEDRAGHGCFVRVIGAVGDRIPHLHLPAPA
jgi:hypothetical protein